MAPASGRCAVAVLLTLAACGGGGDNGPRLEGPAPTNTLAYVDTACRDGADGFSMTQELRVRRGESAPVTIARIPIGPLRVPASFCGIFGVGRNGMSLSLAFGAFQRLGVSPDGTAIVFEVTDDFSLLGQSFVPPSRRGSSSSAQTAAACGAWAMPVAFLPLSTGLIFHRVEVFKFSPNGRLVDFTDMGPGPEGEDAAQVFTLDVETGRRTQVTHLPARTTTGY